MERIYTYDNKTDINRCLNCEKEECNNCLGNFFSANETWGMLDNREDETE